MYNAISHETGLVSSTIGAITRHIRENELAPGAKLPSELSLTAARRLPYRRSRGLQVSVRHAADRCQRRQARHGGDTGSWCDVIDV